MLNDTIHVGARRDQDGHVPGARRSRAATSGRSATPTLTAACSSTTSPARPHTTQTEFDVTGLARPAASGLVVLRYIGADGVLIDAAVAAGAKGDRRGRHGRRPADAAEDAGAGRGARPRASWSCQGTRVGSGRAVRSPGRSSKGWVGADNLLPWKATLLLALGLTEDIGRGRDPADVRYVLAGPAAPWPLLPSRLGDAGPGRRPDPSVHRGYGSGLRLRSLLPGLGVGGCRAEELR